MKREKIIFLLVSGLLVTVLVSCGMSTKDLAKEVQRTYVKQWQDKGLQVKVTEDLILVKKSKTEYTGIMTVSLDGDSERVTVNVVSDGKAWTSKIE